MRLARRPVKRAEANEHAILEQNGRGRSAPEEYRSIPPSIGLSYSVALVEFIPR